MNSELEVNYLNRNSKKKMRQIIILMMVVSFMACSGPDKEVMELKSQVDNLQKELSQSYKPGVGDIMIGIQVHHAKLWFAGSQSNWKLASFQIEEIEEAIEDIQNYQSHKAASQSIAMLNGPVESMQVAIKNHSLEDFKSSYHLLTNTCNSCHQANGVEFNVIKVPDAPQFNNQQFAPIANLGE
jgi:hypothetical protein